MASGLHFSETRVSLQDQMACLEEYLADKINVFLYSGKLLNSF